MFSGDSRNSGKMKYSLTAKAFEINKVDDRAEHIHRNNETNLANLNLNNNNIRKNVENNISPHSSGDTIINVMTSRIDRGYSGTYLIVEIRH